MTVVDDFRADAGWRAVDDRVMGGVSTSRVVIERPGCGVFAGEVSLAHGGGFASVRRPLVGGLPAAATRLRITIRGDGKRYRLTLGETEHAAADVFQFDFDTRSGEPQVIEMPFADFEHRHRGRPVGDGRRVDPGAVRSLGLVIGARQAGPFRLELERIEAV